MTETKKVKLHDGRRMGHPSMLRQLMQEQGLTAQELSEGSGVPMSTLRNLVRPKAHQGVSYGVAVQLSRALGYGGRVSPLYGELKVEDDLAGFIPIEEETYGDAPEPYAADSAYLDEEDPVIVEAEMTAEVNDITTPETTPEEDADTITAREIHEREQAAKEAEAETVEPREMTEEEERDFKRFLTEGPSTPEVEATDEDVQAARDAIRNVYKDSGIRVYEEPEVHDHKDLESVVTALVGATEALQGVVEGQRRQLRGHTGQNKRSFNEIIGAISSLDEGTSERDMEVNGTLRALATNFGHLVNRVSSLENRVSEVLTSVELLAVDVARQNDQLKLEKRAIERQNALIMGMSDAQDG